MSWAEVYKINSDFFNEPLNFNNYINDISIFGAQSYVMDKSNESLWRALLAGSLTMFGHDAIHSYVYNRMTDEDVDYMLEKNQRFGQSMNSFYNTDIYPDGNVDTVLKTVTNVSYNQLESKIQTGINRYIGKMTGGDGAAAWLANVFDIEEFADYTTIGSILSNTDLWNGTIMQDESLMFVISNSVAAIEQTSDMSDEVFLQFIRIVANSTVATTTLIENLAGSGKLNLFFSDANVCNIIAANAESMKAITYNANGFAAMLNSVTAMSAVAASTTAMNVIIQSFTDVTNADAALKSIKTNLSSISAQLGKIPDTRPEITEVVETTNSIDSTMASLQKVIAQADVLASNVRSLVDSQTAMTAIANNTTAMSAVTASTTAMSAVANSATAMNTIIGMTVAWNTVLNSSTAMNVIVASTTAMNIVAENTTAMTAAVTSTTARNAILNSTTAMNAAVKSAKAPAILANEDEIVELLVKSKVALNAMITDAGMNNVNADVLRKAMNTKGISWNSVAGSRVTTLGSTDFSATKLQGSYITSLSQCALRVYGTDSSTKASGMVDYSSNTQGTKRYSGYDSASIGVYLFRPSCNDLTVTVSNSLYGSHTFEVFKITEFK